VTIQKIEWMPLRGGLPVSSRFSDLGLLKAQDVPPINVIGVEVDDEHGPSGAKGVGEIGLVPTARLVGVGHNASQASRSGTMSSGQSRMSSLAARTNPCAPLPWLREISCRVRPGAVSILLPSGGVSVILSMINYSIF
jgi:hypothetical protein